MSIMERINQCKEDYKEHIHAFAMFELLGFGNYARDIKYQKEQAANAHYEAQRIRNEYLSKEVIE